MTAGFASPGTAGWTPTNPRSHHATPLAARAGVRSGAVSLIGVCAPDRSLGSGPRFVEAEDCQIRAGTRLVFHQLPTSPLG